MQANAAFPYISVMDTWLIVFTLIMLSMSEMANYRVKDVYQENFGIGSWRAVYRNSVIIGGLSGAISTIGTNLLSNGYLTPYLAVFGTIVGYIGMQSIHTDLSLNLMDRVALRIGYGIVFVMTIIYLIQTYNGLALQVFSVPVILLYFGLFLIFLFSTIGTSDVRTFAIIIPFTQAVNMSAGLLLFGVVIIVASIGMFLKKVRSKNWTMKIPIIPYLIVPYILFSPLYGLFLEYWRVYTLK